MLFIVHHGYVESFVEKKINYEHCDVVFGPVTIFVEVIFYLIQSAENYQ